MQLTNPIWLWGLTGLLVPIGIHLLSRKEGTIITIGSIRHLKESTTEQSISIRLNELLLLALRCFLIILIVLLLSGLKSKEEKSESWVVLETGLEEDVEFIPLIDSLQKQGFLVKRLDEGFPSLDDSKTNAPINYWMLIEALQTKSLKQAVVISYSRTTGFKGKRISIPDNLTWLSKNPPPIEFQLYAFDHSPDSITIRMGTSNATELTFQNITALNSDRTFPNSNLVNDSVRILPDTLLISVVSDSEFEYDKRVLQATLKTIDEIVPDFILVKLLTPEQWNPDNKISWVVWLSLKPATVQENVNSIIFSGSEPNATSVLEQTDKQTKWILTKRLTEGVVLQEKLHLQLASILLPKRNFELRTAEFDRRVQPEKTLWSNVQETKRENLNAVVGTDSVAKVLIFLFLLSLVSERLFARKRNQ